MVAPRLVGRLIARGVDDNLEVGADRGGILGPPLGHDLEQVEHVVVEHAGALPVLGVGLRRLVVGVGAEHDVAHDKSEMRLPPTRHDLAHIDDPAVGEV